ncbi:hypothetical protein JCM11251_007804 [Rhodosporidiobolus azoricus]
MHVGFVVSLGTLAVAAPLQKRQNSAYPAPDTRGPTPKPEWVATYESAKAAGKIPTFAPAQSSGGVPYYAPGVDTGAGGVCSWSVSHCFSDDDVYQAPTGMYSTSFDDGPLPNSPTLYRFLAAQNQSATHFLIGGNIVNNPDEFDLLVETGGHVGVHTWSHPQMTTLTDLEVLGELGWTAQIIMDRSGFAPSWWRPPQGDVDNRVRAIAKEVFGLRLAGWDVDSSDWCLSEGGGSSCDASHIASQSDLEDELRGWQTGSKSPGILGLEHELTSHSVQAFINTFDGIADNGWDARCIPDLFGDDWYANAVRSETPDESYKIGTGPNGGIDDTDSSSTASASTTLPSSVSSTSHASDSLSLSSVQGSSAAAMITSAASAVSSSADHHPTAQSQVATPSSDHSGGVVLSPYSAGGWTAIFAVVLAFFV